MKHMAADFKLDEHYKFKPRDQRVATQKKLPDVLFEKLAESFAVNIVDWTPEETQTHTMEGQPTCSISLVLEGAGTFSVNNGPSFPINKSSAFVFRTNQATTGTNQFMAGKRCLIIDFRYPHSLFCSYESLLMDVDNHSLTSAVLFLRRQMTRNLLRVAHEVLACQMKGLPREFYLRGKALEVLAYIANEPAQNKHVLPHILLRDDVPVKHARQILEKRHAECWTTKRLSREVGVNEHKLKQGFRELLKTTVHRCLEDIRIFQACELLTSSAESVTAIGLQTGYANPSHFARVFRQKTGETPRQWRKHYKQTNRN